MPAPNQPEPSGLHLPLTMTWMAALTRIVPGLFESWAKPAHGNDHTNKDRAEARKAAIDTLTDAAQKLDGANAALAVAIEEIDAAWDKIEELTSGPVNTNDHGLDNAEWVRESRANAIRLIQEAAKGSQA